MPSRTVLAALALTTAPALADGPELIAYRARCHHLTLFDRPASRECADSVATISLGDGRTGFVWTTDGRTLVAFTAPASGRTEAGDKITLEVNAVNFVFGGEGESLPATGRCDAENPTIWRASIRCEASTAKGRVAADASSLGGPGARLYGFPAFGVPPAQ